jgi:hypothetical protein
MRLRSRGEIFAVRVLTEKLILLLLCEDCCAGLVPHGAPAFCAAGTDGCTPATKVREDQEHGAPAGNIASGASGGTGEMPGEVRRVQGRIATSAPKVRRSWTRGCRRRVKRAPYEAETRDAACKGVSTVRRHAGGLYDAGTYCYTLVKCLEQFVRNGKGVIEANDYTQGSPINSEPLVMKRTHCNEKRAPKTSVVSSVFGLLRVLLFPSCAIKFPHFPSWSK